ncbi:hypothetical protein T492DRAFT_983995 [Pavlovales sp. CCMP2436]|nr:hypothetical protein T492DRAFT_983995 [Pavlovales sp. CCMP2436]
MLSRRRCRFEILYLVVLLSPHASRAWGAPALRLCARSFSTLPPFTSPPGRLSAPAKLLPRRPSMPCRCASRTA